MPADGERGASRPDLVEEDADDHRHRHHFPHPHLIEAEEDRWQWRARIRRDPRKLFFYRIGVTLLGLLLVVAAAVTGPLPGPGGIPLFLLGLAVWASEFEWALKVMKWFKAQFERYKRLSRGPKLVFWVVVVLVAWSATYLTMVTSGIPPWLPEAARNWLGELPGLA
jgi:hypothetical protein